MCAVLLLITARPPAPAARRAAFDETGHELGEEPRLVAWLRKQQYFSNYDGAGSEASERYMQSQERSLRTMSIGGQCDVN